MWRLGNPIKSVQNQLWDAEKEHWSGFKVRVRNQEFDCSRIMIALIDYWQYMSHFSQWILRTPMLVNCRCLKSGRPELRTTENATSPSLLVRAWKRVVDWPKMKNLCEQNIRVYDLLCYPCRVIMLSCRKVPFLLFLPCLKVCWPD